MAWREWFGLRPQTASASIADARQLDIGSAVALVAETGEAWKVWRQVGEIHYATTQQARLTSRLLWDVEIDGNVQDPEQAETLLRAAFGTDLAELVRLASLHLQVIGGFWLARDGEWRVVPLSGAGVAARLEQADIKIKIVNPDPEDPKRPDSPVLAALPVARELLLARAQARAASRNRTAQLRTLLYPLEGTRDPDAFEASLTEVMTAPLSDEKSAASVVPNIIGFPGDWIDKWQTIDLTGPIDEKLYEKIDRLVKQLAIILDIPPEILTGTGDVNHWGAWAIAEENFLGHVEPSAKIIGRALALGMAEAAGLDPELVEVTPDPSPLLRRRPATADVLTAFSAGLVSGEWARAQLGADEDDAPDEPPPDSGTVDTEVVVGEPADPQVAAAPVSPPFSTDRLMAIDRQAYDSLADLADLAIQRLLEKAGAKLRSQVQGDQQQREKLADVPNVDLVSRLGASTLPDHDQLVDHGLQPVPQQFSRVINRAYRQTREAGVKINIDKASGQLALEVFLSGLREMSAVALAGKPVSAWQAVRRALTIAGGGDDPAPVAETAASRVAGRMPGVALGQTSYTYIENVLGYVPRNFVWVHNGGGKTDHPQHVAFHGLEFDGIRMDNGDGIEWYPGDHQGCSCESRPNWERIIP